MSRIEEVDWGATFRDVETSGFGRWLPYNFESGEIAHLGELVVRRVDSSVYPSVEHEVRHPGPYMAWKHGMKRARKLIRELGRLEEMPLKCRRSCSSFS